MTFLKNGNLQIGLLSLEITTLFFRMSFVRKCHRLLKCLFKALVRIAFDLANGGAFVCTKNSMFLLSSMVLPRLFVKLCSKTEHSDSTILSVGTFKAALREIFSTHSMPYIEDTYYLYTWFTTISKHGAIRVGTSIVKETNHLM